MLKELLNLPRVVSWNDNDNARSQRRHLLGHATEEQSRELTASSPAHHHDVGFLAMSDVYDAFGRVSPI